jgi:hypothetical protein
MPFQSEAQRRLFYAKAERGEIPKKTVEHWEEDTSKNLPERVKAKKKAKKYKESSN